MLIEFSYLNEGIRVTKLLRNHYTCTSKDEKTFIPFTDNEGIKDLCTRAIFEHGNCSLTFIIKDPFNVKMVVKKDFKKTLYFYKSGDEYIIHDNINSKSITKYTDYEKALNRLIIRIFK